MADEDVKVRFGAETEGLEGGATRAGGAVQRFAQTALGSATIMGVVGGVAANLSNKLFELASRIANEAVPAFMRATEEVRKLSIAMGSSPEEASVLRSSLDDVGYSSAEFTGIMQRMQQRLRDGGDRFEQMGVKVHDAHGNLLPLMAILENTITRLGEYKVGIDRNLASQELLGRSFLRSADLMRLNKEMLESNKQTLEEFGAVITGKDLTAAREFQLAMNDMKNAFEAIFVVVGRMVLPIFTDVAKYIRGELKGAFEAIKPTIQVVLVAFEGLKYAIMVVWELMKLLVEMIYNRGVYAFNALQMALNKDFKGALAELKKAWKFDDMDKSWNEMLARMAREGNTTVENIKRILGVLYEPPEPKKKKEGEGGTATYRPPVPFMKGAQDELQELRDTADLFNNLSIQDEIEFWEKKLALVRDGSDEEKAVRHNLYDAIRRGAQEELAQSEEMLQRQMTDTEASLEDRLRAAVAYESLMGATYGEDTKKFRDAERQKNEIFRQLVEERKRMALSESAAADERVQRGIEAQREQLRFESELGKVSSTQFIEREQELERAAYASTRKRLLFEADMNKDKIEEHRAILNKIEALDEEFRLKSQKAENKYFLAVRDRVLGIMETMKSAMAEVLQGMINRTMTWQQAMLSIWNSMLSAFINWLLNLLYEWIAEQFAETMVHRENKSKQTAGNIAAATASLILSKATTNALITDYASEAGAAAYKSIAAWPYWGAMAAPAAGQKAQQDVLSYRIGGLASLGSGGGGFGGTLLTAQGGAWEIPSNQLAMVHAKEMVIPADKAAGLRNVIDGKKGHGGGNVNVVVKALDSSDVRRFLERNGDKIGTVAQRMARNPRSYVRGRP